jgi:hypothetical protein
MDRLAFGGLWLTHPEYRPLAIGVAVVLVVVAVVVAMKTARKK